MNGLSNLELQEVLDFIKKHEECRMMLYRCSQGFLTIGFGRNLDTNGIKPDEKALCIKQLGRTWTIRDGITVDVAEKMLHNDLEGVVFFLRSHFEDFELFTCPQKMALCDMVYQLGLGGFIRFSKMIKAIRNNNWDQAVVHGKDSLWAKQQTPKRALEVLKCFTS
jgi:lysozyme